MTYFWHCVLLMILIYGKHSLLKVFVSTRILLLSSLFLIVVSDIIFTLRTADYLIISVVLESFQTSQHLLALIIYAILANWHLWYDCFLRFNRNGYCLVFVWTEVCIYIFLKDIGVFRLLSHFIIVVRLLERINCFHHCIHLLNWLVNLPSIFQESLTCDQIAISALAFLFIVVSRSHVDELLIIILIFFRLLH